MKEESCFFYIKKPSLDYKKDTPNEHQEVARRPGHEEWLEAGGWRGGRGGAPQPEPQAARQGAPHGELNTNVERITKE